MTIKYSLFYFVCLLVSIYVRNPRRKFGLLSMYSVIAVVLMQELPVYDFYGPREFLFPLSVVVFVGFLFMCKISDYVESVMTSIAMFVVFYVCALAGVRLGYWQTMLTGMVIGGMLGFWLKGRRSDKPKAPSDA